MNESLVDRIKQCPSLPSLPAIAMQVLDLAQRPDVDLAEIARIISRDPALSGKILRTVNSSFYGRSQNVSTVSHALVILGLQSVKTLVLGFSLVSNLTQTKAKGFRHLTYWRRSVFAATAARTVAAKINLVQQEEAFLTALLSDIGMLVLDQVLGDAYGDVHARTTTHAELAAAEQAALGMTHADASGILLEQWRLPPVLAVPIAKHHAAATVTDAALRPLAELTAVAQRCADVFVDDEPAQAIADVRRAVMDSYNMDAAACDALMAEIGGRTKEVAGLFEINIGPGATFEAILKRANEALIEITLQSQQRATSLAEQNARLQQAATTDVLTGLSNRARFDAFLAEHFASARATGQPLALLLLDVDRFKAVNDRHGHQRGDAVLRSLGALLRSAARPQDLAARYGGEEMCLVLPGTTRRTATAVADSVRRAVAARPVAAGVGPPLPVTVSIGVAAIEPGDLFAEPGHLLKAADLALYAAKRGGRNCVKVFALPPAAAKPAAAA
jgi:diguanylate cyclase (GGDEF)-like protein